MKRRGIYYVKTIVSSRRGVPDLLCCFAGNFVGIELKRKGAKMSELQKYNQRSIEKSHGLHFVVDDYITYQTIVEKLMNGTIEDVLIDKEVKARFDKQVKKRAASLTLERIMEAVSAVIVLDEKTILSRSRITEYVYARKLFTHIALKNNYSGQAISRYLGEKRDSSTILLYKNSIIDDLSLNIYRTKTDIEKIELMIY